MLLIAKLLSSACESLRESSLFVRSLTDSIIAANSLSCSFESFSYKGRIDALYKPCLFVMFVMQNLQNPCSKAVILPCGNSSMRITFTKVPMS